MRPIFAIPEKYFDYKIFLLISLVIGLSHFDLNLVDDHAWRQSLTLSISKTCWNIQIHFIQEPFLLQR